MFSLCAGIHFISSYLSLCILVLLQITCNSKNIGVLSDYGLEQRPIKKVNDCVVGSSVVAQGKKVNDCVVCSAMVRREIFLNW